MTTIRSPFEIERRESGQTLAAVLRRQLGLSWSEAKALIARRRVRLGGQTCADPVQRVKAGQRVDILAEQKPAKPLPKPKLGLRERPVEPMPDGIVIRFVDDHIVVVEKPPGLTTMRHDEEAAEFGARGRTYLPKTLAEFLPQLLSDGKPVIAVHRIDRDTSGLVVFARTPGAASHLGRQFLAHSTERTYLAIVRGIPKSQKIESTLVRDRGDGRRGSVDGGQRAVTHVRVIEQLGPLALVECRLETGRTHQVRIHLGEMGCPLAGETIYDRPLHGAPHPDPSEASRMALHAATLGFVHPGTEQQVTFSSPLPADMKSLLTSPVA